MAIDFSKMAPVRSLLGGLGNVNWNAQRDQFGNRSIDVGNGINLQENKDFWINPENDRAYGDFSHLGNLIGSNALQPWSQNTMAKYNTQAQNYANIGLAPKLSELDIKMKQLQNAANDQRNQAQSAYSDALNNLNINRNQAQSDTTGSIGQRNLDNSAVSEYLRQATHDKFQPMRNSLETEKARQLTNIGNNTATSIENMANLYAQLQADQQQKQMDYADKLYSQDQAKMMNLAQMLNQQGQQNRQNDQQDLQNKIAEAGMTGEYNGNPTYQRLLQEANLTGNYNGQPTWERTMKEQELANQQKQRDYEQMVKMIGLTGNLPDGSPTWEKQYQMGQLQNDTTRATGASGANMTAGERANKATANYFNKINQRYNENMNPNREGGALEYPAYYAIKSALADPQFIAEAKANGVNPADAVNMFLQSKGISPSDFFTGTTASLKPIYDSYNTNVAPKSTQLTVARNQAEAQAYSKINELQQGGKSPEEIKQNIQANAAFLKSKGVDVGKILKYIDENVYQSE